MNVIRVLLIYDSALMRDGLKALLGSSGEIQVVGEAATIAEGMALVAASEPHAVLMDVSMQILHAMEAAELMRERHPQTAIIMLCRHCGSQPCFRPLQGHALLLSKTHVGGAQLVEAIRSVCTGKRAAERASSADAEAWCGITGWSRLSGREREVLKMVADGKSSSEIARMVKLSPKTVQTYRARIMSKLRIRGVPELIKYAVKFGLTSFR